MHPGIDSKMKWKSSWKMSKNHENNTRKQNFKTLKTMVPCERGTLLGKSAGFKTILEDIQIKHEKDAQVYPNIIQNTI